ncbi:hypothetical protein T01_4114 [Trichinella spiralis]|uniref:Uncharacterized protein n=1 Tax=Trichinella spiralis TaxID=6334 RepID=A0A0V1ATE9_TRISP|nr:hypothetical protein T01_4114 [Trichinella spiralis]
MVTARDGGKEEIIKIIRNVVVNATVNGPGRDGLIKSILDLEKSVQHTLMLIIQVVTTVVNLKRNPNQQCCERIIELLCLCIVNRWKSSHSLYFARDEMAAEYDELLQQENSDDAERMRRLLDEVDVLWSHVAEADAVGDYVVTLEKISFETGVYKRQAQSLDQRKQKEKQLIADHLAVLDQEHDRTLGERIWDSSCVEELRKRLQADENKMDVDFIAGGKVHHAQRLTPMFFKLDNKVVDQCKNNHNENRVS